MKTLKVILSASCLIASAAFADYYQNQGYQYQSQGPGQLEVEIRSDGNTRGNEYYSGYRSQNRPEIGSSVCYAIKHQKNMEMVVETKDIVSKKEMKVNTKIYTIEPYAFGITKDGKPVIRGNVKEEKQFREVTTKFGEDRFEDKAAASNKDKKEKEYSGWTSIDKGNNIAPGDIKSLKVIEDSHFDAPKKYKGLSEEGVQVICQLPITEKD